MGMDGEALSGALMASLTQPTDSYETDTETGEVTTTPVETAPSQQFCDALGNDIVDHIKDNAQFSLVSNYPVLVSGVTHTGNTMGGSHGAGSGWIA